MSIDSAIERATVAEPQTREIDLIGLDGSKAGTVELPGSIFDVQVNIPLIHQVVVAQLAAARQGTHSTKRRGEVRGGGRKPYRQKGTGRARQGSTRAPQFVGGGVVHGPKPRDYSQRTPKKMKAAALRGALSDRARNGRIHVVTGLIDGDAPSTKSAIGILSGLSTRKHVLVVAQRSDELTWQSLRNAVTVHMLVPDQLNTYDVLVSDDIVFTQDAFEEFLAGPSKGRSVTASASESEAAAVSASDTDQSDTDQSDTDQSDTDTEGSDK
jgi:large subunit ribosomal protein L4